MVAPHRDGDDVAAEAVDTLVVGAGPERAQTAEELQHDSGGDVLEILGLAVAGATWHPAEPPAQDALDQRFSVDGDQLFEQPFGFLLARGAREWQEHRVACRRKHRVQVDGRLIAAFLHCGEGASV